MRRGALLCALALACGAPADPPADAPAPPPPAALRASVVLEPPRIEIGDLFTVEVAVVTPPDHRVAPVQVPKAAPGLVIVDAELPSVDREPGRWVHRQRFRARARATGPLVWPELALGVETPAGERVTVTAAARPFEVVSLLAEHPERRSPFSFRAPSGAGEPGRGPWLPALLGSLFTLAALGLIALVRRVRSRPEPDASLAHEASDARAERLLAALRRAEGEADLVRAADVASEAFRAWAAERFRAPRLRRATTEELAVSAAPYLLSLRYPAFLAVVQAFDALRFPPPRAQADELRAALARARDFLSGGSPLP